MQREDDSPLLTASVEASPSVFSDNDQDDEEEDAPTPTIAMPTRRRGGVSSESQDGKSDEVTKLTFPPKSPETKRQLEIAVARNILFTQLESDDRELVFGAMEKVIAKPGDVIIKQGDEGDYFYIIDSGDAQVWKSFGAEPIMVKVLKPLDSFGELALIYNCPRAATVKTVSDAVLWRIDRVTYRSVIMGAQMRKRKLYESFLEKVPILEPLQKWERSTIADALVPCNFNDGDIIIKQGGADRDSFYIIVEGEVRVTKVGKDGNEMELSRLGAASYFGEIALLTDRPRAATVTAIGPTKCVQLDRDRFVRLMGPCEDVLRRNIPLYNQYQQLLV
eukprot:TRINITY_DN15266_c0_g1_i1.p1 TRINITY_DN15266_c0_g1~~TRINITY_DN15266_c0_g1_i1.p1  ORF type:complete len:334 (+),score=75.95 TRINITY_DN15266_c0_g1_i1:68-1069(+)